MTTLYPRPPHTATPASLGTTVNVADPRGTVSTGTGAVASLGTGGLGRDAVAAQVGRGVVVKVGKPKMQAVGACLRKLVMIGYGVLKNRAPFDPEGTSTKVP